MNLILFPYRLLKKIIPTQKTNILYGPEQTISSCHLLSTCPLLSFGTILMLLSKGKVRNLALSPRGKASRKKVLRSPCLLKDRLSMPGGRGQRWREQESGSAHELDSCLQVMPRTNRSLTSSWGLWVLKHRFSTKSNGKDWASDNKDERTSYKAVRQLKSTNSWYLAQDFTFSEVWILVQF